MYGVWRRVLAALVTVTAAAACSSGDKPEVTGATVPTEATTSTTLSVEQEVEQAYLKSWDVYAAAMRTGDAELLRSAYDGDALELGRADIAALVAKGQRAEMRVEHSYRIEIDGDRAEVFDEYRNHSVAVDATTGEPVEPDPNNVLRQRYVLERREGEWWVVDIVEF